MFIDNTLVTDSNLILKHRLKGKDVHMHVIDAEYLASHASDLLVLLVCVDWFVLKGWNLLRLSLELGGRPSSKLIESFILVHDSLSGFGYLGLFIVRLCSWKFEAKNTAFALFWKDPHASSKLLNDMLADAQTNSCTIRVQLSCCIQSLVWFKNFRQVLLRNTCTLILNSYWNSFVLFLPVNFNHNLTSLLEL